MKYIKKFEYKEILFSVGDIVTCVKRYTKFKNLVGHIDQNGIFNYEEDEPIYGKKYKVLDVNFYGKSYNVYKEKYYSTTVDVKNIETGKELHNIEADLFSVIDLSNEIMLGDWVYCKIKNENHVEELNIFMSKNVGRYINFNNHLQKNFMIEFNNITEDIKNHFYNNTNPYIKNVGHINLKKEDIIYYSKNKEDVIEYMKLHSDINKYNL